jgi:predicted lipoprotein
VDAIDPARPATLDQAVHELAQTKRLAEDEVAAALDVRMGFSDADGD